MGYGAVHWKNSAPHRINTYTGLLPVVKMMAFIKQ